MFELEIQTEFSAAHGIMIAGAREPLHGHNWRVTAVVGGEKLDADGLLCDFHAVEKALREIVAPFQNRNLHDVPPFDRVNPTAEHVARHIAERLAAGLPNGVGVRSVRVTEATNCAAVWRP